MKLKSYAKINLTLKIDGLRPDGFHELESIMQNVSLFDEISLMPLEKGIEISCSDPLIPSDERNICYKAARLIQDKNKIKTGVRIHIIKNIPSEAGLGGGSSNAAAVLAGLNRMWKLELSKQQLMEYAAELGSDVAFFIVGGTALCRGRGEQVQSIKYKVKNGEKFVLIKPEVAVSTKWAYEEWDRQQAEAERPQAVGRRRKAEGDRQKRVDGQKTDYECIGGKDSALICDPVMAKAWPEYFNDFQSVVVTKHPEIQTSVDDLIKAGCDFAQMSGSGSAVFGIVSKESAETVLQMIKASYKKAFLVDPINSGFEIIQ